MMPEWKLVRRLKSLDRIERFRLLALICKRLYEESRHLTIPPDVTS